MNALEHFLRMRRDLTLDDLSHIGPIDRRLALSITYCPVCGLDNCSTYCHIGKEGKLRFVLEGEAKRGA